MTIERRIADDPDFPKPKYFGVGDFRHFTVAEIEEYERKCVTRRKSKREKVA